VFITIQYDGVLVSCDEFVDHEDHMSDNLR